MLMHNVIGVELLQGKWMVSHALEMFMHWWYDKYSCLMCDFMPKYIGKRVDSMFAHHAYFVALVWYDGACLDVLGFCDVMNALMLWLDEC